LARSACCRMAHRWFLRASHRIFCGAGPTCNSRRQLARLRRIWCRHRRLVPQTHLTGFFDGRASSSELFNRPKQVGSRSEFIVADLRRGADLANIHVQTPATGTLIQYPERAQALHDVDDALVAYQAGQEHRELLHDRSRPTCGRSDWPSNESAGVVDFSTCSPRTKPVHLEDQLSQSNQLYRLTSWHFTRRWAADGNL